MNKNELETALKVAKEELKRLTHETIRPHQSFKMRTHGENMAAIVTCIKYFEEELSKETEVVTKTQPKRVMKKEDN